MSDSRKRVRHRSEYQREWYTRPNGRKELNELTLNQADSHRRHWTTDEVELLMTWDGTNDGLTEMAQRLKRTREGCQTKFRKVQGGGSRGTESVSKPRNRQPERDQPSIKQQPCYSNWDPDDCSEWYA